MRPSPMHAMKKLCLAILLPFSALSVYAMMQVGYIGIFDYHRHSPAGWQVFTDLVIGMLLILIWMHRDARRRGRAFWPFAALTLAAGSFGPLLYLLSTPSESPDPAEA